MARNTEQTQENILTAARSVFTNKGYDAAGLREIAAKAGCNVALLNRYFGSKEGLFKAAVLPHMNMKALTALSPTEFNTEAARLFATKKKAPDEFDPMLAIIQSAGSPVAGSLMSEQLQTQIVDTLTEARSGESAALSAAMTIAVLVGTDIMRRVLKMETLTGADETELTAALEHMLGAADTFKDKTSPDSA